VVGEKKALPVSTTLNPPSGGDSHFGCWWRFVADMPWGEAITASNEQ